MSRSITVTQKQSLQTRCAHGVQDKPQKSKLCLYAPCISGQITWRDVSLIVAVRVSNCAHRTQHFTLHYIRTIYSGLSNNNFKDHYGEAVTEQRLRMIAGISMFSISDGMLQVMEQTGRQQVDCSRDAGQQQQMSDRRQ